MDIAGEIITKFFDVRARLAPLLCPKRFPANVFSDELAENGVVILRDLPLTDLIADINRRNQRFFNLSDPSELIYSPDGKELLDVGESQQEKFSSFYFLHIKNYQLKSDVYRDIIPSIDAVLRSYYQSNYYVRDIYCYRTQPIHEVQGSYSWHVDNYPAGSLKVMIYLTDVMIENGPFALALKSHIGFRPHLGRVGERYEESYVRQYFKILHCVGNRGTVVIFNNNAIHRAVEPVKDYRDVVNFTVFPCIRSKQGRCIKGLDLREEKTFLKKYTR